MLNICLLNGFLRKLADDSKCLSLYKERGIGETIYDILVIIKLTMYNRSMKRRTVVVNDKMQKNFRYVCIEPAGKNFHKEFKPALTPGKMLELGIFGGKYMSDCKKEFPAEWFRKAKLCPEKHDPSLNYFGVNASQPLSVWRKRGWIYKDDPRGWFQWYCRYYIGRRLAEEDERQIKRWKAIKRHIVQIKKNCKKGNIACRPKQRQAVLHWAYDSRKI